MKKLTLLVSAFALMITVALAEVNLGVSAMYLDVEASGKQKLKTSNLEATKTHSDDAIAAELFLETVNSDGLVLGIAVIPGEAEIGSSSESRTDKLTSGTVTVTNKAAAEFSNHTTLYTNIPLRGSDAYVKLGFGFVNVKSTESLGTGAQYGDENVNFGTIGLGYNRTLDNGLFARVEGSYSSYEEISLNSTGSDAVSTITADLDVITARFSIGKTF